MISKGSVNKKEQVKKLSGGLDKVFSREMFSMTECQLVQHKHFFQGCRNFSSGFLTPEWHHFREICRLALEAIT